MRAFFARDWFTITGRGKVAAIDPQPGLPDPGVLKGQHVLIDGERYLVIGVEMNAVPEWSRYRLPFGLVVRPVTDT